jgi:hypothetical protein
VTSPGTRADGGANPDTGGRRWNQGISPRAVLVGTALAVIAAVVAPYTNYLSRTWNFGWGTLPNGPVVIAFVLVALNGLFLRWRALLGFTRADVLTIYIILTVSAALITVLIPYIVGLTAFPLYQAPREIGWDESVLPHVPLWLQPSPGGTITWFCVPHGPAAALSAFGLCSCVLARARFRSHGAGRNEAAVLAHLGPTSAPEPALQVQIARREASDMGRKAMPGGRVH